MSVTKEQVEELARKWNVKFSQEPSKEDKLHFASKSKVKSYGYYDRIPIKPFPSSAVSIKIEFAENEKE